jgi:hypothetical protein
MRRDQLEHAIRTACQIIGRMEVIVLGSQSSVLTKVPLPAESIVILTGTTTTAGTADPAH